jgi:PAS domain S-box-containing protein
VTGAQDPAHRDDGRFSREIYLALLDNMTEGVSLSTEEGVIVFTNRAEDRMFGYEPGELIGQHVSVQNAYPPEENGRVVSEVIDELKRTGAWSGEWSNRRRDGSFFTTRSRITEVEVAGRQHWLCVQADITEDEAATEALRESEERLEIAAAAGGVGIWDWDVRANTFVYSPRAKAICGFDADEDVTYADVMAVTHPEDFPLTRAQAARALDPAIREDASYEYRIIRPGGEVRWVLAQGAAVFSPIDGVETAVRYLGTIQDVTERRRLEEAERAAAQRLRLAIDAGRMAVWELEVGAESLVVSPELNRILGFPEDASPTLEEIRSRYFPGEAERLQALGAAALGRRDRFLEAEYRYWRPDGALRWLLLRCEIMLDEGGAPAKAVGVLTDVTERKEAEQRLQLMINELNHRVKNNLATVQALASQTLRGDEPLTEAREAFMARLVALGAAHDVLTREQWEGAALAEIARGVLEPLCGSGSERLSIMGPEVQLTPRGALSIAIALHELCTNAAKYGALATPAGRITLRWVVTGRDPDRRLSLEWRESGGPPVARPTRKGFGSRLLERAIPAELRGEVSIAYEPAGVVCRIEAPVETQGDQLVLGALKHEAHAQAVVTD